MKGPLTSNLLYIVKIVAHPRSTLYQGSLIDLGVERVDLPNGQSINLEIVRHPGGAAIVTVNSNREICLIRQYRHAVGGWIWELPAGKIDSGEQPLTTAKRELAEETGVTANNWKSLGSIYMSPGFCDEQLFLYLATELHFGTPRLDEHEIIEVHWKPLNTVYKMLDDYSIFDAKTVAALCRSHRYL
ncbi:NUDIX hydrolase [Pseudomonadota bacterium]